MCVCFVCVCVCLDDIPGLGNTAATRALLHCDIHWLGAGACVRVCVRACKDARACGCIRKCISRRTMCA